MGRSGAFRALIGLAVLGLAACGDDDTVSSGGLASQAASDTGPSADGADQPCIAGDGQALTLNEEVAISDRAVVGTILSISAPVWNSESGEEWASNESQLATPWMFRDAVLAIEEAVYGEAPVGETLTVRLYGTGVSTCGSPSDVNLVAGPADVGARVLWVLREDDFFMREGAVRAIVLADQAATNWRIEGALARSAARPEPIDVATLQGALRAEHDNGDAQALESEPVDRGYAVVEQEPAVLPDPPCVGEFCPVPTSSP
jgi:hypothetical protein